MGYASSNAMIALVKQMVGLHKLSRDSAYDLGAVRSIISSGVRLRYCGRNYRATDACMHMAIFEPSEAVPTHGCRHIWAAPEEFLILEMRGWAELCKVGGSADNLVIGASKREAWASQCVAKAKRVKLEGAKVVTGAARRFAVSTDILAVLAGFRCLGDIFPVTIAFGYTGDPSEDAKEVRKNNMIIVAPNSKEWLVAYAVEPRDL